MYTARSIICEAHSNIEPIGSDYGAALTSKYLNQRKASIYGGSKEIQNNLIGKPTVGL